MKLLADFTIVTGLVIMSIILISLISSKNKEQPQKILIAIFGILFFVSITFYGFINEIMPIVLIGFFFFETACYLIGPLLLLYIRSLQTQEEHLVKKHWYYFIPCGIYFVLIVVPLFISILIDDYLFGYLKVFNDSGLMDLESVFQGGFFIVFCLLSLRSLQRFHINLKHNYSNLKEKDLTWVKYLVIGFLMVVSIDISTSVYEYVYGESEYQLGYFTMFPLVFLILYLGYYGSTQSQILLPDFIKSQKDVAKPKVGVVSHSLANVGFEAIKKLEIRLLEILEKEQPYLDENLTLGGLAKLIPTTDKKLSALLNHHLEISFYDLINNYRVEEVKKKIANKAFENYTLLAIGFECGFRSKTSFYRSFKKITGLSPSEYKIQH